MIGRTVSHYRIVDRLGQGGMGIVYRAEDLQLGRTVALKFLPPELTRDEEAKQRFLIEARAASRLDHPNICTVHDAGETDDGQMYIVMAYYEGETLAARIARGPVDPRTAVDLVTQIARGLAKAHDAGIVHRDVKPANVIVTSDGIAKVVDFGVAKLSGVSVTRDGTSIGTVAYMAPEQFSGREVSPATDVWALGVVLYEMLTGRCPFEADNHGAMIHAILHDDPPPLTIADEEAGALIARLLSRTLCRNPKERYRSAAEMLADLDTSYARTELKKIPRRRPRIHGAIWLVAGAALLVIAALLAFRQWKEREERAAPAVPAASRQMVAVMPFQNLGAPGDAFFADGITEEVITRLAAVKGLGVISRTSVYAYDRRGRSARQIGRDLGVAYLLEGTVRWERDGSRSRVRVTPQLIRVADDTQVWGDSYDREFEEVFAVQSEIARNVIDQLGVRLAPGPLAPPPTASPEAYDTYLRALPARFAYAEEQIRVGIAQTERAVSLDPSFAAAHALLGHLHVRLFHQGFDRSRARLEMSRQAIDRALAIQPWSPDGHIARGYLAYWGFLDHATALEEFGTAKQQRPGDASLIAAIGFVHRRQGRMDLALSELLEARKLDPRNQNLLAETAQTLCGMRRFAEADRLLASGMQAFPRYSFLYMLRTANELVASGTTSRAKEIIEGAERTDEEMLVSTRYAIALFDRDYRRAVAELKASSQPFFVTTMPFGFWGTVRHPRELLVAQAEEAAGNRAAADTSFRAAVTVAEGELRKNPADDRSHAALALALAGLGRRSDAIRHAERAVELCPLERNAVDGSTRRLELARVYAMTGEREKAVAVLQSVLARPATFTAKMLSLDPGWGDLGADPRLTSSSSR